MEYNKGMAQTDVTNPFEMLHHHFGPSVRVRGTGAPVRLIRQSESITNRRYQGVSQADVNSFTWEKEDIQLKYYYFYLRRVLSNGLP
jgi:hypothetical protein